MVLESQGGIVIAGYQSDFQENPRSQERSCTENYNQPAHWALTAGQTRSVHCTVHCTVQTRDDT